MIELYAGGSPNVQKVIIGLEECGLPYKLTFVNYYQSEQYDPAFLKLNPNAKVPVIVDHDGPDGKPYTCIESGAILLYLADKTGMLMPEGTAARFEVIQWLMVQMASIGPMFGQFNHFSRFAPEGNEYGLKRYTSEVRRLYDLLETRLGQRPYVGGETYSVADIAVFPWIRSTYNRFRDVHRFAGLPSDEFPRLGRWFGEVGERPAVQKAYVTIDANPSPVHTATPDTLDRFFGRGRYERK